MQSSPQLTYIKIIEKLHEERDKISDSDFEQNHYQIMSYVVLLHSALECFLREVFKKHTNSMDEGAVKNHLKGKAEKMSIEHDLELLCNFFIPNINLNFETQKRLTIKRNHYVHRTFKEGVYNFQHHPTSKEQLDADFAHVKKVMLDILNATLAQ